jgi:hypothetical protein
MWIELRTATMMDLKRLGSQAAVFMSVSNTEMLSATGFDLAGTVTDDDGGCAGR